MTRSPLVGSQRTFRYMLHRQRNASMQLCNEYTGAESA